MLPILIAQLLAKQIQGHFCEFPLYTAVNVGKLLLNDLPDSFANDYKAFFEMDVDGKFTYSNRYGFKTFGYTEDDLNKGVNALKLFIPANF